MKASLNASCGKEMVPKSEKGKVNGSREVSYVQEQKKRPTGAAFCVGGDKGSRTPDLLNAIETLYQLSYIPMRASKV